MPDSSARLDLPFLMPSQAQKHVTHNEALEILDLLVQLVVEAFDAASPPAAPEDGRVWALGAAPGGVWAGQPGRLAAFVQGGWVFIAPQAGWRAWGRQDARLRLWDGDAWVLIEAAAPDLQTLPGVGINASSDTTNRLAVSAPATLLTHEGAGHQLKINKAAPADTGSLLFQTGFSGRAEMGTAGADDFAVKVSADGAVWRDGIVIDAGSGAVAMPNGAAVQGLLGGSAVTQSPTDTTPGRLMRADHGYSRGNLVGAVSHSGGTPTGAVIERGSGPNGAYVRFGDGTQICWRVAFNLGRIDNTGDGTITNPFRTEASSWTFPASFSSEAFSVSVSLSSSAGIAVSERNINIVPFGRSASAANALRAFAYGGATTEDILIDLVAVGRWF